MTPVTSTEPPACPGEHSPCRAPAPHFPSSLLLPFLSVPHWPRGSSPTLNLSPSWSLVPARPHTLGPTSATVCFRFSLSTPTSAPATNEPGKVTQDHVIPPSETFRGKPCLPFQAASLPQHTEFSLTKGTLPPSLPSAARADSINSRKEMIKTGLTQPPDKRGCWRSLLPSEEQPSLPSAAQRRGTPRQLSSPWHH